MAIGAGGNPVGLGELSTVSILMALFATGGRRLEVCVNQARFHVGRFVAIDAACGAMSAHQGERSLGMIKALQVFPGFGRMTGPATGRCPVRP